MATIANLKWLEQEYRKLVASQVVTVAAGSTSQAWNHGENTTDVAYIPIVEPKQFHWLTRDDANNITVHIASAQLGYDHEFLVLIFA